GIVIYEGNLLPEKYRGALIHADAGPNVVRAYMPSPSSDVPHGIMGHEIDPPKSDRGAGYKAEFVELVKAGDSWFRPSDVCVAPDGSVFIADWYDPGVGGHATGDTTRGRIYRLAPKGNKPSVPKVDLNSKDGILAALGSSNLAVRFMAMAELRSMRADP